METPMVERWADTDHFEFHPLGTNGRGGDRIRPTKPTEKSELGDQMLAMYESGMKPKQIREYFGIAENSRQVEWSIAAAKDRRLRLGLS